MIADADAAAAVHEAQLVVLRAAYAQLCAETDRLRRELAQRQRQEIWDFIERLDPAAGEGWP
jgi:hypothetical protein